MRRVHLLWRAKPLCSQTSTSLCYFRLAWCAGFTCYGGLNRFTRKLQLLLLLLLNLMCRSSLAMRDFAFHHLGFCAPLPHFTRVWLGGCASLPPTPAQPPYALAREIRPNFASRPRCGLWTAVYCWRLFSLNLTCRVRLLRRTKPFCWQTSNSLCYFCLTWHSKIHLLRRVKPFHSKTYTSLSQVVYEARL